MPECDLFINCDNKNLSWEQLVRMLAQVDANGCPAANTVTVSNISASSLLLEDGSDLLLEDDSLMLTE